jgi:hypothetical protein
LRRVIYFGGAPNGDVLGAQYPPNAVLMSFTLQAGLNTVTGAEWYGSCGATACGASPKFTIAIYPDPDDKGMPGTPVILLRQVGSADQTAIGNNEYAYSFTLPPALSKTLTAGTWAMMLLGFAGLGVLGHRRIAKARVA